MLQLTFFISTVLSPCISEAAVKWIKINLKKKVKQAFLENFFNKVMQITMMILTFRLLEYTFQSDFNSDHHYNNWIEIPLE